MNITKYSWVRKAKCKTYILYNFTYKGEKIRQD